jgi:hypothetical protein
MPNDRLGTDKEHPVMPPTVRGVRAGDLADDNASCQRMLMHAGV